MSLEEQVCMHKLAAESQRKDELSIGAEYIFLLGKEIPLGCMAYFKKGCYSCSGINKKEECKEYIILQ